MSVECDMCGFDMMFEEGEEELEFEYKDKRPRGLAPLINPYIIPCSSCNLVFCKECAILGPQYFIPCRGITVIVKGKKDKRIFCKKTFCQAW